MHDAVIIVPCYNEAARIDAPRFLALSSAPGLRLLFANDGSTDSTADLLASLAALGQGNIDWFSLAKNSGKAEAVRQGMLRASQGGASFVGFADSDLATPPQEILRLLQCARETKAQVVMGARVALAGTRIERKAARHHAGRVFATLASLLLQAHFYDTQCGAKVFRNTELFRASLAKPFRSRWIFDVELIGRMLEGSDELPGLGTEGFLEVPLQEWVDVDGSKLRPWSWARAALDLAVLGLDVTQRRRRR